MRRIFEVLLVGLLWLGYVILVCAALFLIILLALVVGSLAVDAANWVLS